MQRTTAWRWWRRTVMCLFICKGLSVQLMSYSAQRTAAQFGSCFNQLWAEHFSQRNSYRPIILTPFSSRICSSGRADSFHKRSTMKRREGKQRCSNIFCCSATFAGEIVISIVIHAITQSSLQRFCCGIKLVIC